MGESKQDNRFHVGTLSFEATGDRVLIEEDTFKSGYECSSCGGTGKQVCTGCQGSGHSRVVKTARCSACSGEGHFDCNECHGKGGLLAVPETSQRRPTTGKIVSVGEKITVYQKGESVLYSNFAGHVIDLEAETGRIVIRILHENEVLSKVTGHIEYKRLNSQREMVTV